MSCRFIYLFILLLGTLPDNWDTLVVALGNSAPNGKLSLSMVKESLFNGETRRKGNVFPLNLKLLSLNNEGETRAEVLRIEETNLGGSPSPEKI